MVHWMQTATTALAQMSTSLEFYLKNGCRPPLVHPLTALGKPAIAQCPERQSGCT